MRTWVLSAGTWIRTARRGDREEFEEFEEFKESEEFELVGNRGSELFTAGDGSRAALTPEPATTRSGSTGEREGVVAS